ncbi:MAG: DEAD/DEAH box helicase family protein [Saprospiraceae bacterium]|nr:DEAD/DEAH box helicase family protein [Saprospiraceae bacterium]
MINRFSSRRQPLHESFLNERLRNAKSYDRIAGYFSSSILEVAGEALETIEGKIRIVCNSDLDVRDVETAKAAEIAIRKEWCAGIEEKYGESGQPRFAKLYQLLQSGKMEVRVLPSELFGLIHGKAGVIHLTDATQTAFMGSANETYSAWKLNYELVWEDPSSEAVQWVQEEFNALWNHPKAVKLPEFVIEDIGRISKRKVVSIEDWAKTKDPAGAIVESPVYRREYGLWAHQKYFVQLAFGDHVSGKGARYVLADMVGLGKTVQLALAAQLMALYGDKPVLIIAPKTLLWQWQDEMVTLLDMPSAVWDGKQWVDENGYKYPMAGVEGIRKCPRRVGIVSQGLIVRGGELSKYLLAGNYECVVVDECHRARRRNLKPDGENEPSDPNNLLRFLYEMASRTKSLLLATATPVQLYPIEAYDLLDVLSRGNDHVLGNDFSMWRKLSNRKRVFNLILGREAPPANFEETWEWIRNPVPAAQVHDQIFGALRRRMEMPEVQAVLEGAKISLLSPVDKNRIERSTTDFFMQYNPFIRHIVRRTRTFLETTVDPETHEPYLKPVHVRLFGENEQDAIPLPGYLEDAYQTAESFCRELGERMRSAGFMRTMLLRRIGSSIEAGKNTAIKMLGGEMQDYDTEEDDDAGDEAREIDGPTSNIAKTLTEKERTLLLQLVRTLEKHKDRDPKYLELRRYLLEKQWLELGCIVFSQYYDTVKCMADLLTLEMPAEPIGIYAGSNKSAILKGGRYVRTTKEEIKASVRTGEIRILFGTDAASEGLNLQRLGTLINLDLPWNPTRLEQRKGRIQRIGQVRDTVYVYNMRYKGSVEDRVHELLSSRLEHIFDLFGQIPDVLEDAWVEVALGSKEKASEIIDAVPIQHPFEMKYNKIEKVDFERCAEVLNDIERREILLRRW